MKIIYSLFIIPLLAGCETHFLETVNYQTLKSCITECVDAALADIPGIQDSGGHAGGGSHKVQSMEWHYRLGALDEEIAAGLSELRQLLITRLTQEGANIHGRGSTGTDEDLFGFSLDYTSAGEEGIVWAARTHEGDTKHIFILWHGVNIN